MQQPIPILDLTPEVTARWSEFQAAFESVMKGTHFIMGPNVKAFEEEFAAYVGVKHAIGCNSGTDAITIGLRAMGIGPGHEVICPSFTFFATAESVSSVGAKPVFVDIDPNTLNLDVNLVAAKITPKTKAVIPVHLFGNVASMGPLLALAKERGLKVLEDVAQATGAEYGGRRVGGLGDIGAFSFFPSKNLGACGDGGMITTNDDKFADECRMLRVHGSKKKYHNEVIGYNSRLDELQAAMLRIKLKYLESANEGRRQAARRYDEVLKGTANVALPTLGESAKHVYHQYTIRITNGRRDAVAKGMADLGVSTMIYYPVPLHQLPVYAGEKVSLPHTEKAASEVISLPIWPEITPEIQLRVLEALKASL